MKKWHMIIDVEKCEDCNNCLLACKDEHVDNEWTGYSKPQPNLGQKWINVQRKERGTFPLIDVAYRPTPCMHCDDAPCIKAGQGSVTKRPDGIVIIDPEKSKGKKEVVKSCPYDVIWWNEELSIPQKCTFCAHLKDEGWKEPRCVQVCPTGALKIENLTDEEFNVVIENKKLKVLHKDYKTSPRVYYENLYRFEKCFIAGSVSIEQDGIVDCAEEARVVLYKDDLKIAEEATDNYGDFKFDCLDEDSGEYTLEVFYKDKKSKVIKLTVKRSVNVGDIEFR